MEVKAQWDIEWQASSRKRHGRRALVMSGEGQILVCSVPVRAYEANAFRCHYERGQIVQNKANLAAPASSSKSQVSSGGIPASSLRHSRLTLRRERLTAPLRTGADAPNKANSRVFRLESAGQTKKQSQFAPLSTQDSRGSRAKQSQFPAGGRGVKVEVLSVKQSKPALDFPTSHFKLHTSRSDCVKQSQFGCASFKFEVSSVR